MDTEILLDFRDSTAEKIRKLANIEGGIGTLVLYTIVSFISLLFLISVVVGTWSIHVTSSQDDTPSCIESENPWRLPHSVYPTHYTLDLYPNIANSTFTGSVDIELDVMQSTSCVMIHAEDLRVWDVELLHFNGKRPVKGGDGQIGDGNTGDASADADDPNWVHLVTHDNVTSVLHIALRGKLQAGDKYRLKMSFSGNIRNDLRGFYRSHQVDANGREQWIAVTHFEPVSARTAFPVFDDPSFKAEFTISITLPPADADKTVLGNMPEENRAILSDGSLRVQFKRSVKMSSYLVAYVIGYFDHVEAKDTAGSQLITYRVYTMPGKNATGVFALEVAQKITKFLTTYFGIDYDIPKMDLVAIPDFNAGAMENWGLLTFRDKALLIEDSSSTIADKQYVASTVAHEVSHQWTGNLVTGNWWSDLWLNEGFATFFEVYSVEGAYPGWDHWDQFLVDTFQPLLQTDALPGTHPLVTPVNDSHQIEGMFDRITYNKGSSILRMLIHFLGEDVFQQWMRAYYSEYRYMSTETEHLFNELANVVEGPSLTFSHMRQWTHAPGYPVLHLIRTGTNSFKLRQERFFSAPPTDEQRADDKHWWVPVTLFDSEGKEQTFDFQSEESPVFNVVNAVEWIKVNKGSIGIYRVNYTVDMWTRLIRAMEKRHVRLQSTSERFGLVDDVFALGLAGYAPMYLALDMARALRRESSFVIWSAMINNLIALGNIIAQEPYSGMFDKYMADLVQTKLNELGWSARESDGDDDSEQQLRALLISVAARFGDKTAVQRTVEIYERMEKDPELNSIPAELRTPIYDNAVRHGGDWHYNAILARFRKSASDVSEKNRCMYALTAARLPHLIRHTLEMTLTDEIRSQDGVFVIRSIAGNSVLSLGLAWDFVRQNFDTIVTKFGIHTVNSYLIPGVASLFTSEWKRREVVEFFQDKPNISDQFLQAALQTIDGKVVFLRRNRENMFKWLEDRTRHL